MSATNNFETQLLAHIFTNNAVPSVGDTTGLQGSQAAGKFFISLHTAALSDASSLQSASETSYTNYLRAEVNRSSSGWSIAGNTADNAAAITFNTCSTTGATLTDFGLGSASTGAGVLQLYGALTSTLAVSNGVTPEFALGALDITLD
jgi:hypothetical protein